MMTFKMLSNQNVASCFHPLKGDKRLKKTNKKHHSGGRMWSASPDCDRGKKNSWMLIEGRLSEDVDPGTAGHSRVQPSVNSHDPKPSVLCSRPVRVGLKVPSAKQDSPLTWPSSQNSPRQTERAK